MNLATGEYVPHVTPRNVPLYLHVENNHAPIIAKSIPANINKRLPAVSSDEKVFNEAAKDYQMAVEKSKCTDKLKYVAFVCLGTCTGKSALPVGSSDFFFFNIDLANLFHKPPRFSELKRC